MVWEKGNGNGNRNPHISRVNGGAHTMQPHGKATWTAAVLVVIVRVVIETILLFHRQLLQHNVARKYLINYTHTRTLVRIHVHTAQKCSALQQCCILTVAWFNNLNTSKNFKYAHTALTNEQLIYLHSFIHSFNCMLLIWKITTKKKINVGEQKQLKEEPLVESSLD